MASHNVQLKPSAQKDFRKIPSKLLARIFSAIEALATTPFPPQAVKLANADRLYRLRVGDYRIIYEVEPEDVVVIIYYVRHRREVYRKL